MKKLLIIAILLSGFSYSVKASHIVGGDTRFEQTGANTYNINIRMFRFCSGISYPNTISPKVFDNVTNALITNIAMAQDSFQILAFGDECYTPPGLCVEVYYYSGTANLANNPNGYYVTYSTGGRNAGLVNLVSGNSTWYCQIPDPALAGGNDSPKFVDYPSDGYFCMGYTKQIDFSCTDADGDSLVYSLENPYNNPGGPGGSRPINLATYKPGFGVIPPLCILGPGATCTIDPATGIVSALPRQLGIYVVAVRCQEFRNGVKIGEVFRDLQYAALNCTFNILPTFENFPTTQSLKFDDEGCFDIVAEDQNVGDTFFIQINSNAYAFGATASLPPANASGLYDFSWTDATSGMPDSAIDVNVRKITATDFEGVGKVGVRFCWNLDDCELLSVDSFYVEALGFSIGCDDSKDTVRKRISIPIEKASYTYKVPNVFSPNGDGVNDLFYLKQDAYDRCYDALNIRVYNRWGHHNTCHKHLSLNKTYRLHHLRLEKIH
jgi:hypothetical protein